MYLHYKIFLNKGSNYFLVYEKHTDNDCNFYTMMKIIKILLLFTLTLGVQLSEAQQDSLPPIVKLDTAILAIGDQTHLRLSLPVPQGQEAIFPNFKDSIGHSLEVLKRTIDTLQLQDSVNLITHDYLITSFDTGHIYIPPFEIGLVENGFNSTVTTDTAYLYVASPIVDMQKGIFDIKPPANLPFKFREIIPYLKTTGLILLILLLAGGILYYFLIYRKKHRREIEKIIDSRPAHEKALEALEQLKEKQLWQQEKVKLYYSELTTIIRNYLDERYDLQTMESTSSEIIQMLRDVELNKEDRDNMAILFQHADFAKFAKGHPQAHENDKSWNDTVLLIEHTQKIEVETAEK